MQLSKWKWVFVFKTDFVAVQWAYFFARRAWGTNLVRFFENGPWNWLSWDIFTLTAARERNMLWWAFLSICLSVCLSACVSQESYLLTPPNFPWTLPTAVAGDVAICYALLVLHVMTKNRRREKGVYSKRLTGRQHRTGAEFDAYDCLVSCCFWH